MPEKKKQKKKKKTATWETQNTFVIADSLDHDLSDNIVAFFLHTLNIPCLITAKDKSQVKQTVTEYCFKHTWRSIV